MESERGGYNVKTCCKAWNICGNGVSLLYSMAGGVLSYLVMLVCKKAGLFSIVGISVVGGVFHNLGQLLAAMAVLQNENIVYYFPVLLAAGVVTDGIR